MADRDINQRTYDFSLRVIRLCRAMDEDRIGRIIVSQVLRSGTSIGANVREAQGGQSKKDFIAKMSIARKEAMESGYWLCLIRDSNLQSAERMSEIIDEAEQIAKIISAIILSAKRNQ
jgi:four helix bundle protein